MCAGTHTQTLIQSAKVFHHCCEADEITHYITGTSSCRNVTADAETFGYAGLGSRHQGIREFLSRRDGGA